MRVILVALLCGLCGFAGYALAMAFGRTFPGPSAGDWLTASSAGIGVVITIAGAVWIEEYRRRAGERHGARRFVEILKNLNDAAFTVYCLPDWSNPDSIESSSRQGRLLRQIKMYRFVRKNVEVTDVELWGWLNDLDECLDTEEPLLRRELSLLDANPENEKIYANNRERVKEAASRIMMPIGVSKLVASDRLSPFPSLRRYLTFARR